MSRFIDTAFAVGFVAMWLLPLVMLAVDATKHAQRLDADAKERERRT